jgi:hypothetical protein
MKNKQQIITINVAQPCKQDWDKMTPTEQGRHCASCNKTVIDFSNYTDKELIEFFKKKPGNSCGNFSPYQLNRTLLITEPQNHSFLYKVFFGTALASWLGIAGTVSAQSNNTVPIAAKHTNTPTSTKSYTKDSIKHTSIREPDSLSHLNIRGGASSHTEYIVDGIKVDSATANSTLPPPDPFPNHTPAQYEGDVPVTNPPPKTLNPKP